MVSFSPGEWWDCIYGFIVACSISCKSCIRNMPPSIFPCSLMKVTYTTWHCRSINENWRIVHNHINCSWKWEIWDRKHKKELLFQKMNYCQDCTWDILNTNKHHDNSWTIATTSLQEILSIKILTCLIIIFVYYLLYILLFLL